jgi:hypothetical protein
MCEPVTDRTIVYWPALASGVAQVQVAEFIVGQSRHRWASAQVEHVLAAFR